MLNAKLPPEAHQGIKRALLHDKGPSQKSCTVRVEKCILKYWN